MAGAARPGRDRANEKGCRFHDDIPCFLISGDIGYPKGFIRFQRKRALIKRANVFSGDLLFEQAHWPDLPLICPGVILWLRKRKEGRNHDSCVPLCVWLPDLGSNQGPTD